MTKPLLVLVLGFGMGALLAPRAEAQPCTPIPFLPATIVAPGSYCLSASMSTSRGMGNAITVEADDVVLDLGGFLLDNTPAGPETHARGIYALNRKRLTVRNGIIRGFRYGVLVADSVATSEGHLLEVLTVQKSRAAGIALTGADSHIRNCHVAETRSTGPFAVGISQTGSRTMLTGNVVVRTRAGDPSGYAAGIDLNHGFNRIVRSNQVRRVEGGGVNYGIRCGRPFAARNRIFRVEHPASTCAPPVAGDPDAYPYPYPYPFDYPYPYPYPHPLDAYSRRFGAPEWDVVALALLAALGTKQLAAAVFRV
jgi:hypothetical protein